MAQELMVDVHGPEISVFVRGTSLKMTARKGNAPGWFARNCELMTLRQFSHVMNSRSSLGPPLTIRPARWAGLFSRA
jgi:hypothetical protein